MSPTALQSDIAIKLVFSAFTIFIIAFGEIVTSRYVTALRLRDSAALAHVLFSHLKFIAPGVCFILTCPLIVMAAVYTMQCRAH